MIIKNVIILEDNQVEKQVDVLIEDGIITSIKDNIEVDDNQQVIDGEGNYLLPGLVDVHVHFREPGFVEKETIKTGCASAVHGGYTTVMPMPNLNPYPDNVEMIKTYLDLIKQDSCIDVLPYATITKQEQGKELVDFKSIKELGINYFSDDGVGVSNNELMKEAFISSRENDLLIVAHTEDTTYGSGCVHEGEVSKRLGVSGIPSICEYSQIERDLKLCQETNGHYHICHMSCKESVDLLKQYKSLGVDATGEVTPHHLLLNETYVVDSSFKMNPPLRSEEDQQALIKALSEGVIDFIATDHAPHTKADKDKNIEDASFGIIGLDHSFSLLYTEFVKNQGLWTIADLINYMSFKPAKRFGLNDRGIIKEGFRGDCFIFNPNKTITISEENTYSKSTNTPFMNKEVNGEVVKTLYLGKVVYETK